MDGPGKHRAPDLLVGVGRLLVRDRPVGDLHLGEDSLLGPQESGGSFFEIMST